LAQVSTNVQCECLVSQFTEQTRLIVKSRVLGYCVYGLLGLGLCLKGGGGFSESALSASLSLGQFRAFRQESVCEAWPLRIMPLGDSITHGATVAGGYRTGLWEQLQRDRWVVDFVGSQFHGPIGIDRDHEGHPGKAVQFVREEVRDWLNAGRPHVILLMIGTNDVLYPVHHDFPGAAARLDALVGQITTIAPDAEVLVASIPVLANPAANDRASVFAREVQAIANMRAAQGRQVTYVDMYSVLALEDLADGVHPNAAGYEKMADVWYEAIAELMEQRCQPESKPDGQ